ncbi:MAG: ATP phosphoribosyltransferase regulatory subunit [Gemmatimonadaceae bacterium]
MSAGALPGFRDFYPTEFAERAHIMRAWRAVARRFGFVEYDGPPLEALELYTKKSGDEIVGQLYNFTDKGGREVALRPEMTPTVARMVAARANALRKPVKWFSLPQLFRYERMQRGRLREHFQLNLDIFGESDVGADAEILAVALEIMRELGLNRGAEPDVLARVSDRQLLTALLAALGVPANASDAAFAAIDKIEREPRPTFEKRFTDKGMSREVADRVFDAVHMRDLQTLGAAYGADAGVRAALERLQAYLDALDALGVGPWVRLDLRVVRGLAYYTGIVFELFDAAGELRAICGGGRYDTLLADLSDGDANMPALGFGMGDVVLSELLRERGLMRGEVTGPDFWLAADEGAPRSAVLRAASALRELGCSVDYALKPQSVSKQRKAAYSAGARYFAALVDPSKELISVDPLHAKDASGSSALGSALPETPVAAAQLLAAIRAAPERVSPDLRERLVSRKG